MRDVIHDLCPEAAETSIELEKQIQPVLTGLDLIKSLLGQSEIRGALAQSEEQLRITLHNIVRLDVFKNLHDALHQLQIKPIADYKYAARSMPDEPLGVETLEELQDHITVATTTARKNINRLDDNDEWVADELLWVHDLEDSGQNLEDAIDERSAAAASRAIANVRRILRQRPASLSHRINRIAQDLPLGLLTEAVGRIAKVGGSDTPALASLHKSIRELHATLRGRIGEHDLWQTADNDIWIIEEAFDRKDLDDFEDYWPSEKVDRLIRQRPGEKWSEKLRQLRSEISDELAHHRETAEVPRTFDLFRRRARRRFWQVDLLLKADCEKLVRLGEPLQEVLRELSNEQQ